MLTCVDGAPVRERSAQPLEAAKEMHGGIVNVVLAIAIPLSAAVMVMASETLTSPAHAERHSRSRNPADGWDRFERVSGCVLGLMVLALMVGAFVYLWSVKPSF